MRMILTEPVCGYLHYMLWTHEYCVTLDTGTCGDFRGAHTSCTISSEGQCDY